MDNNNPLIELSTMSCKSNNTFTKVFIGILILLGIVFLLCLLYKIIKHLCNNNGKESYKERGLFDWVGDILGLSKKEVEYDENVNKERGWDNLNTENYQKNLKISLKNLFNNDNSYDQIMDEGLDNLSACVTQSLAASIKYKDAIDQYYLLLNGDVSNKTIGLTFEKCIDYNNIPNKRYIMKSYRINNNNELYNEFYNSKEFFNKDRELFNNALERINLQLDDMSNRVNKTSNDVDNYIKNKK
tara:strand:+ start:6576 stop:7304 length:729 start_codon:yes stop_codon:yes gene_type:complete